MGGREPMRLIKVNATEMKNNFGSFLAKVQQGEVVAIRKNSRVVAWLTPPDFEWYKRPVMADVEFEQMISELRAKVPKDFSPRREKNEALRERYGAIS